MCSGSIVQFEVVLERLPAFVVLSIQFLARLGAPFGHSQAKRRLEHEGLKTEEEE